MNTGEADLVAQVVTALKETTPELSIGVITPYQKQRNFVTGKINKL
jgi:superfamily I DNA and/or RNA helicase